MSYAAFVRGKVGWTQLRLLCRVANPDDERDWLALASRTTASALACEVRAVDRCAREAERGIEAESDARVGVVLRCPPAVRARWWRARQLANRVAGHTLSGEAFAEALAAEVCSAVPLDQEVENAQQVLRDTEGREVADSRAAVAAPAPLPVSPFPADLEQGLVFAASPEVAHLFRATLAAMQRRLERNRGRPSSQSEALDAMLEHVLACWGAYQQLSRVSREHRVYARDGWRCTVPGCSSYRSLHAHHIVFRSHSGSDELANLTTLCAWHHQRGVHQGLVRCAGQAPHALHFELGRRVGRPPLLCYGPGEVRHLHS